MKLHQLRYVWEVYRHHLNISQAADALYTSQPGISKQLRLLEDELGVSLFVRQGKKIVALTEPGELILKKAEKIMRELNNIYAISADLASKSEGQLTIAGDYDFTRQQLPHAIARFKQAYPKIKVSIYADSVEEVIRKVSGCEVDLGIITQHSSFDSDLLYLPGETGNYDLLLLPDHPLALKEYIELQDLLAFPLITYSGDLQNQESVALAYHKAGLPLPEVSIASMDTDTIKAYVLKGLGIGLINSLGLDWDRLEADLEVVSIAHLFSSPQCHMVLRQGQYLHRYMYDLIGWIVPGLSPERIDQLREEKPSDYMI